MFARFRSGFVVSFAFVALTAMIALSGIGCGGGGGGGASGGSGGGSFSLYPATVGVGGNGRCQLLALRNGLPIDVTWSSTAGVITPTGIGTATFDAPGSGTVTITATAGTQSDTTVVTIDPTAATVLGRVVDDQAFLGVQGVIVDFKQGTSNVASATTMPNGYFAAAVPITATRFHLRASSINAGFYKQFSFNALRYTALDALCSAPLPGLAAGTITTLSNCALTPTTGPPPPPPNGCS